TCAGWGLFMLRPAWFPLAITAAGLDWDRQFSRTLWITGAIFTAAQLALVWVLVRGRRARSAKRDAGWLEYIWTGATAVLFLSLAFTGSRGWATVAKPRPGMEIIEVYAHQFAWHFRYPGPDGRFGKTALELISDSSGNSLGLDLRDPRGRDDIVAATLRIPIGRPVLLVLHSRDVIHDFFVRELRTKQDVVPGMEIPLEIQVDTPGQYEIACAELCGLGHSQMRSLLIALPAAEFDRWKANPQ
ncbi:MAG: cytochrome c oxidase, subunit, partial [Bryobacterales bacterium]|nr:cytochrome c oxidase, subunit [Bryobacterales bacterium]